MDVKLLIQSELLSIRSCYSFDVIRVWLIEYSELTLGWLARLARSRVSPLCCRCVNSRFVKDIEINDLRNRYVLTKGATQQQVSFQRT